MQTYTHSQRTLSAEAEILQHFREAGDRLEAESRVLDTAIRDIVIHGKRVTSKAIIIYLIAELESTSDVVQLDVLRHCLEIVVGRTPDDEGI